MGRRLLAASVAIGTLALTGTGVAVAHRWKPDRVLHSYGRPGFVYGVRGKTSFGRSLRSARIASSTSTFETAQQFRCEVPVGTGPSDSNDTNVFTRDTVEYKDPFSGELIMSCIGSLPAGTTVDTAHAVAHDLVKCGEPGPSHTVVYGKGVTITFPDGMYDETCSAPA